MYSPAASVSSPLHLSSYTLTFDSSLILPLVNLPYTNFICSRCQISFPYSVAYVVCPKNPAKLEAHYEFSYQSCLYNERSLALRPSVGPLLVRCPRLLIQYIGSYPTNLEVVSSIPNPRTSHAVVTMDPV
jgi:hypothetical protein